MSAGAGQYSDALSAAAGHAQAWLASLPVRHVGPAISAHDLADDFAGPLPEAAVDDTQVSLSFGDDATTRAVTAKVIEDGKVWMSGSRWQGRDVLRVSVSNWSTDTDDVGTAVDAVRSAFAAVRAGNG